MADRVPDSSECPVFLPVKDLKTMIRLVKALYQLQQMVPYRSFVTPQLPESARLDPGHESVMMGYDFHLTTEGPRLIEVNTNAGGVMLAWQAHQLSRSLSQEAIGRPASNLMATFNQEMDRFSHGRKKRPERVVIIDSEPEKQFLYPEMQQFALLFRARGVEAEVVDPGQLEANAQGVFLAGKPVDLIYNRHCDFYLETPPLAGIRAAYLAAKVCLTPNPRAYGLLADKRRMLLWSSQEALKELGVGEVSQQTLLAGVPPCHLLKWFDADHFWSDRRSWVVKPVDSFGSRGVILGKGLSRNRFNVLCQETTLVQKLVPPSTTPCPWDGKPMKTDLRLFVYGAKVLGVTARIYQGQVTNFKEPGSGYAPVRIVP
ncbi:MAG: hypothetical protein HQL72_04575 [Magnetococcales bacterium]|nr:hypothetical protein [Magnetococcales bacterium]